MSDDEKFDAIIIGAGPAGTACAYVLAKNGKSVLLVTHGGVFQRLTEYLNEVGCACDTEREFTNTCVFVLDFSGYVPVILQDCDACHLGHLKTADDGHLQV